MFSVKELFELLFAAHRHFNNHLLSINMFLRFFGRGAIKANLSCLMWDLDVIKWLFFNSWFLFSDSVPSSHAHLSACLSFLRFDTHSFISYTWSSFVTFPQLIPLLIEVTATEPPPPQSSDWGVMLPQAPSSQRCYLGISNHWVSHLDWKRGREGWMENEGWKRKWEQRNLILKQSRISAAAIRQKETSWLSRKTLKSRQFIYVALRTCLVIAVSKK